MTFIAFHGSQSLVPCPPHADVHNTIVLTEGELNCTESIECTSIEADTFSHSIENKRLLIQGDISFARHYSCRKGAGLRECVLEKDGLIRPTLNYVSKLKWVI